MKKKHQPGCPCCTIPNPCGCAATQVRIDFTRIDDIVSIYLVQFIPGPCNELTFEGFSALEGEYYVSWPTGPYPVDIVLAEIAATNNPQESLNPEPATQWCMYARIIFTAINECVGRVRIQLSSKWYYSSEFDSCLPVEDHDWLTTVGVGPSLIDHLGIDLCTADNGIMTLVTAESTEPIGDCEEKTFTWEAEWNPVF